MKKKLTIAFLISGILWYAVFGIIALKRMSGIYTDTLCLSVKNAVKEVQQNTDNPDAAWGYIVRNKFEVISIDEAYYFELDVILCDNEWYVTAVPSVSERYLSGVLKRLVFLDFSKVYYPVILGSSDNSQQFLEEPSSVLLYKSTDNKCEALDHLDFGKKYFYR